MKFGSEVPEDDELLTYIIFAETYGWSPKDIEHLSWDKVIKLRVLVEEIAKEKSAQLSNVGGGFRNFKL